MKKHPQYLLAFVSIILVVFVIVPLGHGSGNKIAQDDEYYYEMGLDLFKEGYYELIPEGKTEKGKQKLEQAISALEAAVSINDQSVKSHYLLARIYVILNEYQAAAEQYQKIIELDPDNIDIYLFLASAYVQMKKYESAHEVLNYAKALSDDPRTVIQIEELVESIRKMD